MFKSKIEYLCDLSLIISIILKELLFISWKNVLYKEYVDIKYISSWVIFLCVEKHIYAINFDYLWLILFSWL